MKQFKTPKQLNTFNSVYNLKGIEEDYIQPHSHTGTCEIILSMSTGGNVIIKNKLFPLTKKGLYFIYGPDVHYPAPLDDEEYLRSRIVININFLKKICQLTDMEKAFDRIFSSEGGMYCLLKDEDFKKADEFFRCINNSENKDVISEFKMADAIISIIELLKMGFSYIDSPNFGANKSVDRALKYIGKNIAYNISIDDISNYSQLNKFYLCHLFKAVVGMTISQYIKVSRISMAKKELIHTSDSISQISKRIGFNSISYFGRVFFEEEGMTPSEFRKAMQISEK